MKKTKNLVILSNLNVYQLCLDLKTLGALKSYALMYRNKWKDIIDLYFILRHGYDLKQLLDFNRRHFW